MTELKDASFAMGMGYGGLDMVTSRALPFNYASSTNCKRHRNDPGMNLEWGAWGVRNVRRYGQPTHDFETGRTRSCAQHG
jgi:hypothetical protein